MAVSTHVGQVQDEQSKLVHHATNARDRVAMSTLCEFGTMLSTRGVMLLCSAYGNYVLCESVRAGKRRFGTTSAAMVYQVRFQCATTSSFLCSYYAVHIPDCTTVSCMDCLIARELK